MKKILALLLLLGISAPSEGEVLYKKLTLMDAANQAASTNGPITTFPLEGMPESVSGISCRAVADNDSGTDPTLDIVVQTCTDTTASNCDTLCTFTQCTASAAVCWTDGTQTVDVTGNFYPYFRAVTTLGGTTPVHDVVVEIRY